MTTKVTPKRTLLKAIKNDMILLHLTEEMGLNKDKWKKMIHVPNTNNLE